MNRCHVHTEQPDGTDRVYLGSLAHVRGLKYSHSDPGGPLACSFTWDMDPRGDHRAIRQGRKLTVLCGALPVWTGVLAAPGRDMPWQVQADGLAAQANNYRATGTDPWDLDVSVAAAVTRGLPWTLPSGMPSGYGNTSTAQGPPPLSIADVLNDTAPGVGFTWWVDTDGLLHVAAPPSTPTVKFLTSGAAGGRTLSGTFVTAYHVTYINSSTGATTFAFIRNTAVEAAVPQMIREEELDLTSHGPMTSAEAGLAATAKLALNGARAPFGGSFTFTDGQVLNMGSVEVDLPFVKPPLMGRLVQTDPDHIGELVYPAFTDLRVGQTEYDDETGILTVTPFDVDPKDFVSVLRDAVRRRR